MKQHKKLTGNGIPGTRVEHIELITELDLTRMKKLGAVASMQPRHAAFAGFFEPPAANTVFFTEECARAYPWELIRRHGIPLSFSTDWPVVPVDVLANIQCALAPLDLGPEWADQRQTLPNALAAYSSTNAWIAFKENHHGALKPGHAADLVIINGNIEQKAAFEIGSLSIAMTICDGDITFDSGNL